MARSGHVIGNHTWDHPSFPLISRMERRAQIRAWEEATAPYGAKLFRPPYGDQSFASRLDLWLSGYQVVTWNIDMQDWRSQSAEELGESLAMNLKPGSILLLHDRLHTSSSGDAFDREAMLRAVEMLLRRFQNQYRFVTVPELMRQGHPNYSSWLQAPDIELRNRSYQQNGHRRLYT
jgi:peptidoglycan/xylan/chitin deacetylase (PgdA/CDA1 family)